MHLLQLAANEWVVVLEGETERMSVSAATTDDGSAAAVRVRPGGSGESHGQRLEIGETLVIAFQPADASDSDYTDPDDPQEDRTAAHSDDLSSSGDLDDGDLDDGDLDGLDADDDALDEAAADGSGASAPDQVSVTLVHVYGDEAVLRFAVPEDWEVSVRVEGHDEDT